MSDLSELLIGIALIFISIGSLAVFYPRGGKTAWFVGKPFIDPAMSILIIGELATGLILLAAYFTTIDNMKLSG